MMSEPRCGCNDEWLACIPEIPELTKLPHKYMRFQIPVAPRQQCRKCGYYKWNDAYIENMYRDLKEMNS